MQIKFIMDLNCIGRVRETLFTRLCLVIKILLSVEGWLKLFIKTRGGKEKD
jgi:hypothetical protein